MHCRVTSETGMKTVEPSVFTIHSLKRKRFGRRRGMSSRSSCSLSRSAVEACAARRTSGSRAYASGRASRCGRTKTPSSFVQKSSVPCWASGLGYARPVKVSSLSAPVGPAVLGQERPLLGDDAGDAGCGGDEDRLLLVGERNRLLLRAVGERPGHLRAEREATCAAREDRIERRERRRSPKCLGPDGGAGPGGHGSESSHGAAVGWARPAACRNVAFPRTARRHGGGSRRARPAGGTLRAVRDPRLPPGRTASRPERADRS